jgi:fibronectin-binding autotransporter adhesin
MCRRELTGFRIRSVTRLGWGAILAAATLVALTCPRESSAAMTLTGLSEFSTDASGNFSYTASNNGQLWDTRGVGTYVQWTIVGPLGGSFVNSNGNFGINQSLPDGIYTFSFNAEPGVDVGRFGMNLFFNGAAAAPGISVYAQTDIGSAPAFSPNGGTSTPSLQGATSSSVPTLVAAANSRSFASGGHAVTITGYHWDNPTVNHVDRVGGGTTGPSGLNDFTGQITLNVYSISSNTWVGFAPDGNWSSSGNWTADGGHDGVAPAFDGTANVIFAGSNRTSVNVDGSWNVASLAFDGTAFPFTFSGPAGVALNVQTGGITNNSVYTQTFNTFVAVDSAQTWNAASAPMAFKGGVVLSATLTIDGTANTTISGQVNGGGGIIKNGAGTLTFGGAAVNTFTGPLIVNAGTLVLAQSAVNGSSAGPLVIGDGSGVATVRLVANDQLGDAAANTVTINSSGVLDLNGFTDYIPTLTFNGGSVTTGAGFLGIITTGTVTTNANAAVATISGNLNLDAHNHSFYLASGSTASGIDLDISAVVSNGAMSKNGAGALRLSGANTFSGGLTANEGTVLIGISSNLAAGTGPAGTGSLTIQNAMIQADGSTRVIENAINLVAGDPGPTVAGSFELDLPGVISGTGGLTKSGSGNLVLGGTAANTYTGITTVNDGTVLLTKYSPNPASPNFAIAGSSLIIGDNIGSPLSAQVVENSSGNNEIGDLTTLTINRDGRLRFDFGASDYLLSTTFNGGAVFTDISPSFVSIGPVTVNANSSTASISGRVNQNVTFTWNVAQGTTANGIDLDVPAAVFGPGGVIKSGAGTVRLSGANTYSGGTTLDQGTLDINSTNAIGTGPITMGSGTTIDNTSVGFITLVTNNVQSWGGSFTFTGTQSLNFGTGAVTLNANPTVTVAANTLTVGAIGNGTGSSLTKAGAGTLTAFGGGSYTGATAVNAGTLTDDSGPFASSAISVAAGATMSFVNSATAGSGTFTNGGSANGFDNGGMTQFFGASADHGTFYNQPAASGTFGGQTTFRFIASAGQGTFVNNGVSSGLGYGGTTVFFDASSASNGVFTNNAGFTNRSQNGGGTLFYDNSSAGSGVFVNNGGASDQANGGYTFFNNASTAGYATFTTNGGAAAGAQGGALVFYDFSNADHGTFTTNGVTAGPAGGLVATSGITELRDGSRAGYGTFVTNGATAPGAAGAVTIFFGAASADNATLITNGGANGGHGGETLFQDAATGGTARVVTNAGGRFDISGLSSAGLTVGSIEGAGTYILGGKTLTFGSLATNTTVSGAIVERGGFSGTGASIVKTGAGTTTLSGANAYTGNTTVSAGTLKFSIASGTPTIGAGVTVTVADGATLELAGSISALGTAGGNRAHIVNGSLGASGASAGLVVSGTNQVVGGIDGSGSVAVNAASDLTADHIVQNALTIGGTPGKAGLVTIDASDASGNPLISPSENLGSLPLAGAVPSSKSFDATELESSSISAWARSLSEERPTLPEFNSTGGTAGTGATAVPEPATLLLAVVGLLLAAVTARPLAARSKAFAHVHELQWRSRSAIHLQHSGRSMCRLQKAAGSRIALSWILSSVLTLVLPAVVYAGIGWNWASLYPIGGNHYEWGYETDYHDKSNWTSGVTDWPQYNFPGNGTLNFGVADNANITDHLSADEFIDLATEVKGKESPHYDFYELDNLLLDAGPLGHSYTIEQYNGGGALTFVSGGHITVGNDAGNDVIACPIDLSSPLTVSGNKLLISGSISGINPGAQLIVENCLLTLSGNNAGPFQYANNPLATIILQSGTLFVSSASNMGSASTVVDFQGGTLHPTASFSTTQGVTTESAGGNVVLDPGISLTLAGTVSGSGVLTLSGGGTFVLAPSTPSSASLIVESSTLAVANSAALSSAGATVTLNSAKVTATTPATVNAHLALATDTTFNVPGGVTLAVTGPIDGFGGLTADDAGTLVLSGNINYRGTTTVSFGTLRIDGAVFPTGDTTIGDGGTLTFVNSASAASTTYTNGSGVLGGGQTDFHSGATAANGLFTNRGGAFNLAVGGVTQFSDATTTAANGIFLNSGAIAGAGGGQTIFNSGTTAAQGVFLDLGGRGNGAAGGQTLLNDGATAGNGTFTNYGGTASGAGGGATIFSGSGATAANAVLTTNGGTTSGAGGGQTIFNSGATGGSASITANGGTSTGAGGGQAIFNDGSIIGAATLVTNGGTNGGGGGLTKTIGNVSGGTARVATNAGGTFDISQLTVAGLTVGSIEGAGTYSLGSKILTFGSLATNTTVSGAIADGGIGGGTGGSIVKVGAGTTVFSGVTAYTGSTAVNAGTLTINGAAFSSSASTVAAAATMNFVNGANAGNGTFTNNNSTLASVPGALIQFSDTGTTAGHGIYTNIGGAGVSTTSNTGGNGGQIVFNNGATAGNATIATQGATLLFAASGSQTLFNDGSSAGNATITTGGGADGRNGGPVPGGLTLFSGDATAGAATLITNAGLYGGLPGFTEFKDTANGGTANITINTFTINEFINFASAGGATIATHGIYSGLYFEDNATAGTAKVTTNVDGLTEFRNTSTAGNATIITANGSGMIAGAVTRFHDSSDAGHAHITTMGQSPTAGNAGSTLFYDSTSAANGIFTTNGGTGDHGAAGVIQFRNNSTAANGTFTNLGGTDGNGAYGGELDFYDSSNAGTNATIVNGGAAGGTGASGGVTQFFNASKAGTAAIANNSANDNNNRGIGGHTYFNSGASADHATITNNGGIFDNYNRPLQSGNTVFYGGATADHATLTTSGALIAGGLGGEIDFNSGSDMASATITNNGGAVSGAAGGFTYVNGSGATTDNAKFINNGGTVSGAYGGKTYITSSTAANDTFINNGGMLSGAIAGETDFVGTGTAAASTLISNGGANGGAGGATYFISDGGNTPSGGTARVIANAGGIFDISGTPFVTVGSIEGAGVFQLGGATLTSGSLNTDTTVSGVIVNGGYYGGSNASLVKEGTGKLTLTGDNTYTGSTTINGGTLKFNISSGTPTIGSGAIVTVASGATLELAGSVSALGTAGGKREPIVNDSTASGIVVSGTNQVVGGIDGPGNTQVNAGSGLTANHIIQGALIIGGTAGSPALVTIDASDASGNPLGVPSGFALAESLTPSGPFEEGVNSSASLSSIAADSTDLAVSAAGNSVGIGNTSQVPEPSTLLLALLAVLVVISIQFVRHRFRFQAV